MLDIFKGSSLAKGVVGWTMIVLSAWSDKILKFLSGCSKI